MKKTFTAALCVILVIVGCTKDPNYSKERLINANPEITLFEDGITIPLDSVKSFMLKDVLKPEKKPQVTVDKNGCYCLNLTGELLMLKTSTSGFGDAGTERTPAKSGKTIKFNDREIKIGLPDILKDERNKFYFSDPGITITITNPLNYRFNFSGKISAYRNDELKGTATFSDLKVAGNTSDYPIKITEENCKGILNLVNTIPDKLILSSFTLSTTEGSSGEIKENDLKLKYQITTPFIFKEGTNFSAEQELKNAIKIGGGVSINEAEIAIEVNNLTDFELTPEATIKIDDEEIILFEKESVSIGKKEKKTVTCTICKSDLSSFQQLGDISLGITASISRDLGYLKEDSGIILTIKSISIPNGITVNEQ